MESPVTLDLATLKTPEWWRSFAPELHVDDAEFLRSKRIPSLDEASASVLRHLIQTEGYFQLPPVAWPLPLDKMVSVVKHLRGAGLPLPFSFIYDEFWYLYLHLHSVIEAVLGKGYLRLPDFWTWLVDPQKDESGWHPHRDKDYQALFDDGSPKSITIWLPLTDATTLNGCMYLVPANRDPVYGTPRDKERLFKYSDIRALPAAAGSVLCWNQAILHWGSHSSPRETLPRVSCAFEFQAANVPPMNEPLSKPGEVPNFDFRMRLIGKQILQYHHMYPLEREMANLAHTLVQNQSLPIPV